MMSVKSSAEPSRHGAPYGLDLPYLNRYTALMSTVKRLRQITGLTQAQLADLAGTSQPTIAAYETGSKVPSWRTLQRLARASGLNALVSFVPEMTREDRRSLFLHQAIATRLLESPTAVLVVARRNVRRAINLHPGAGDLLREWDAILRTDPETIAAAMTDPGRHARDLRQVTPFAGVLSASDRAAVYSDFRRHEAAA